MTEYASEEMRNKWLEQIPARRMATPYELKGVINTLKSPFEGTSYWEVIYRHTFSAHQMPPAT